MVIRRLPDARLGNNTGKRHAPALASAALVLTVLTASLLSGCMALALAPTAAAVLDKSVNWTYETPARKPAVFNAALKTMTSKGQPTTIDRENGLIRADVVLSLGTGAYHVVAHVEEKGSKTTLRVEVRVAGPWKLDLSGSDGLAKDVVEDIQRQIGAKLERVS
jgi:hypothetical protein